MSYKLSAQNGKVKYIMKQKGGNVGSDTSVDSANWMLDKGDPRRSDEFPGYPIAVTVNGNEYHFSGEWKAEQSIFAEEPQNGTSAACGPDYCEIEPVRKPRRRRTKDIVLE